jgi:hypothetical protein
MFANCRSDDVSWRITMSEEVQLEPAKAPSSMRRTAVYAAWLLAVFLLGFVPMWLKSRECSGRLSEAEHRLSAARIENSLASAVINAQRGDYEPARQDGSIFFTSLRAEIDKGKDSALSQVQREGLQSMLISRDEIITLLARSDPASADRLSDLYVSYRKSMSR